MSAIRDETNCCKVTYYYTHTFPPQRHRKDGYSYSESYCVDVYTYTFSKTADPSVKYTSAAIEMGRDSCRDGLNPSAFKAGQEDVPCWEPILNVESSTFARPSDHPLATFYNCGNLDVSPFGGE